MKTSGLMAVAALLFAQSFLAHGQSAPAELEFNFETKRFTDSDKLKNLKRGDWYCLKITNINMNLYKISADKSDSIIKSDLKTPGFDLFNVDVLTKIAGGLSSFGTSASLLINNAMDARDMNLVIESDFLDAAKFSSEILPGANGDIIKTRMNEEKKVIEGFLDRLTAIKTEIDGINYNVAKYLLASKVESNTSANYTTLQNSKFDFAAALTKIEDLRKRIRDAIDESGKKKSDYMAFYENNKAKIDGDPSYKENDGKIKDAYSAINKSGEEAMASISADKANQLLSAIVLQDNNKAFTYTSFPQQFNGDAGSLKITIAPRSEDLKLQTYSTEIKFPKASVNYAGLGLSFYGSGLFDEAYSVKITKVDTIVYDSLVSEDPEQMEFGTAIILRYGWKLGQRSPVGLHLSFGPALSLTNKVKARIVFGGGVALGTRNMLVLDGGLIGGYVDRLSKAYENYKTENYFEKPTQATVPVLKTSWFISLGYMYRF